MRRRAVAEPPRAHPPPLEIVERGGLYVLVDDGPAETWRYVFVPS